MDGGDRQVVTGLGDLPVRIDWSTRRVVDLMHTSLISAGTLSPTGGEGRHIRKY